MNILAIESSCDETAAAIISGNSLSELPKILSNVVVSQIDIFKEYGGVIPEIAARSHLEAIIPVIHKAFNDASLSWKDIDAIAVTNTPGLLGSLLVGTLTARTLAILHNKPLYPIHHLKSHIYSASLEEEKEYTNSKSEINKKDFFKFPKLALVISGGHTQILYMKSPNSFKIIGTTLDDAVGEAFDKIAKILGLPYPGGPSIAKAAKTGNPTRYDFPHPHVKDLDFSFSGLKTAVLRRIQKELNLPLNYPSHDIKNLLSEKQIADFAASFQKTAIDILIEKLLLAIKLYPDVNNIIIAGGVSANKELRQATKALKAKNPLFPDPIFSGDNAAMVGVAALSEILSGTPPTNPYSIQILPRSEIK